ncbi:sugar-binding protein [Kineococcus rhizosphaerae]|uniref:Carbohydrate binding protein with CBM9 domain n=1 Tax=Kineococcus rhizosphaerae TaxID=559628 RepID=A0A2T0R8T1_9ACTN|nr:sugar-binding protein [Kineococcus rhizosphaerae]PRY17569.1 carbohydrate binding protein with CBM9 domain [Kineococcus rhizosphaerae]
MTRSATPARPARALTALTTVAAALAGTTLLAPAAAAAPAPPAPVLSPTRLGNVFTPGAERTVVATSTARSVTWTARQDDGAVAAHGRATTRAGRAVVRLPGSLATGWYSLDVVAAGGTEAATTSLAVLDAVAPAAAGTAAGTFGVATHYATTWPTASQQLVAPAGATSVRDEAFWGHVETTPGVLDFSAVHARLDPLIASGVRPLLIADYGNPLYDGGQGPTSEAGRAAFARYAAGLAAEFGPHLAGLEVWNEWDVGTSGNTTNGAADYVALLEQASAAVRAAAPGVPVLGPAVGNLTSGWLEDTFRLGALDHVDAVVAHPYSYPSPADELDAQLDALQALVHRYAAGRDRPVWITELGWPTGTAVRAVGEREQAANTVKAMAIATTHDVGRYYAYDLVDDGDDPADTEQNFGLLHSATSPQGAFTPKPAYAAFAATAGLLRGASAVGDDAPLPGVVRQRFRAADGTALQVLWAGTGTGTAPTLAFPAAGPVSTVDLYGARRTLRPVDGVVRLQVGASPVWLRGTVGAPTAVADAFAVAATTAGDPATASWTVTNPDRRARTFRLRVTGPTGHPATATVRVGAGASRTTAVPLPAVTTTGAAAYRATVERGGTEVVRFAATGTVTDPVVLRGAHTVGDGTQGLRLSVTDRSGEPVTLRQVRWSAGDRQGTVLTGAVVLAGGTVTADVPLDAAGAWTAEATLDDGTTYRTGGTFVPVDPAAVVDVPRTTVTVDGVLDEAVRARPGLDLDAAPFTPAAAGATRPAGFGGRAWFTQDDRALYLSVQVRDAVQSQPATGASIWQGDGVQFTVAAGAPGEAPAWNEIGVALTAAGPQLHRWLDAAGARTDVEGAQLAVTRAQGTTTYEVALPWTSLGDVRPADGLFSAALVVNDDDGAGRLGWLTWGGGIAEAKDSALFVPLRPLT